MALIIPNGSAVKPIDTKDKSDQELADMKSSEKCGDLETGEKSLDEESQIDDDLNMFQKFCKKHQETLYIIRWVLFVLFTYSYTIAAYVINREHSKKLIGIVIFATICGILYYAYQGLIKVNCCLLTVPIYMQKKIPKLNLILAILAGLCFLGLLIYFMLKDPLRKVQAIGGLLAYMFLCWLFCKDRKKIKWRGILWGLSLQYVFAMLILKTSPGEELFEFIGDQTAAFLNYAKIGARFVFGEIAVDGAIKGDVQPGNEWKYAVWVFYILPTIVFFSAFVSILFHIGALQAIISGISKVMFYTMQTSTVESLNAAGNIFVGMTEAPLMIRPFLPHMTKSEIHAVLTGGFATIAGGVLAAYIAMGVPAKHLIAASVMSCPAALAISKLVYPEREKSKYASGEDFTIPQLESSKNIIEAAGNGASVSIGLCANITVMLITFISFYNCFETWFYYFVQCVNLDIQFSELIGYIFLPFAWMLGIEESQCQQAGELLAMKMLINEYVAYSQLATKVAAGLINERTNIILTYALCGFGNISSMGIQVGALTVMAPSRKSEFAKLVVSAMLAGTVACQMTACIAGILLDV